MSDSHPMNAPYPLASEAVDTHLASSIDALRSTTEGGFSRIDGSIRELVTKGEFKATIERLDAKDDQVDARVTAEAAALHQKVDLGLENVRTDITSRFTQMKADDDKRTSKTRWILGTIFVAGGLAWNIIDGYLPGVQ